MPATASMPPNLPGLIAKIAKAKTEQRPERPARKTILANATREAAFGRLPAAPVFPDSNYWMSKHAFRLHELALAGDLQAVQAYQIGGCNTYSRALRGYRDLLVAVLVAQVQPAPKAKAKAKPKAKAKAKPKATGKKGEAA